MSTHSQRSALSKRRLGLIGLLFSLVLAVAATSLVGCGDDDTTPVDSGSGGTDSGRTDSGGGGTDSGGGGDDAGG